MAALGVPRRFLAAQLVGIAPDAAETARKLAGQLIARLPLRFTAAGPGDQQFPAIGLHHRNCAAAVDLDKRRVGIGIAGKARAAAFFEFQARQVQRGVGLVEGNLPCGIARQRGPDIGRKRQVETRSKRGYAEGERITRSSGRAARTHRIGICHR